MSNKSIKEQRKQRRKARVRTVVNGTNDRPRLSVYISNKNITAQLIDDESGKTLASSTTVGRDLKKSMTEKAEWVGKDIAKKAKKAKIDNVVFDRGGKQYVGRLKKLAESAREEGLKF